MRDPYSITWHGRRRQLIAVGTTRDRREREQLESALASAGIDYEATPRGAQTVFCVEGSGHAAARVLFAELHA